MLSLNEVFAFPHKFAGRSETRWAACFFYQLSA